MTVVSDLIGLVFRDSGVFGTGQTPRAQDSNDMLTRLNMILGQWNRRRWLTYCLVDSSVPCDGSLSYTVGPGGEIDITRPDRIEAAYIRQVVVSNPTPVDWPLVPIYSREDYSKITLKTLAAAPSEYLFYESSYPLGRIYPWPVPNSQYELHILTKVALGVYGLTDTLLLPEEYGYALYTTLVNMARAAYRLPPDPYYIGQQKAALGTIRKSNFQISSLWMPPGITRGPAYNVYSDQGA